MAHPNIINLMGVVRKPREIKIITNFVKGHDLYDILFVQDQVKNRLEDPARVWKAGRAKRAPPSILLAHRLLEHLYIE